MEGRIGKGQGPEVLAEADGKQEAAVALIRNGEAKAALFQSGFAQRCGRRQPMPSGARA